jgi:hypothetical protein
MLRRITYKRFKTVGGRDGDDVKAGRKMQVEMGPWNFNAASRWFRVSSIGLQRHMKSLDNFAESTFTQEVPVSRAFEAYPAKPPQAHERILNQLFLMMKTTARIITGGSWPWRL